MSATNYRTPEMRRRYLDLNHIVGWYTARDAYSGAHRLYEATSKTTGFPTSEYYPSARAAERAGQAWEGVTRLPRVG